MRRREAKPSISDLMLCSECITLIPYWPQLPLPFGPIQTVDACEVMLLSYLGPALRCAWGLPPSTESLLTSVVFAGGLW